MSQFGSITQTTKGITVQAKAQTGTQLQFTRIAVGDGNLNGASIADLNSLISEKKSLQISKLKNTADGKVVVGTVLSNQDVTSGFYFREIGVFAQDPDIGEILYCYANAGALGEYIPAVGGPDVIEKKIDIFTVIGNATNITATIEASLVYETQAGAQEKANVAQAATQANLNSHTANVNNPHNTTATQVGAYTKSEADIMAQGKVDTHNSATSVHGATSAATANRLLIRDANGRAKVAAPSADDDIALLSTVKTLIANLVASSPATLDTLNELATALGNDPNFATTITNALAGKADKSSAQMAKLTTDVGYVVNLNVDIDTVFATGFYYVGSAARPLSPNLPTTNNFTLVVYQFSSATTTQIAYEMQPLAPRVWRRYNNGSGWGAWVLDATYDASGKIPVANLPNVIKLTKDNGQAFDNPTLGDTITSFDQVTTAGFYYVGQGASGTGLTNHPLGAGFVSNGFMVVWNEGNTYVYQQWSKIDGTVYTRACYQGTWSAWKQLATTTQEAWINLTLINGWVSYGGTFATPGYRKNNFGEVELRGMVKSGLTTNGTVIATLPVGYRPTSDKAYAVICNNGTADVLGYISISTGGGIIFKSGANTYLSLESIPPIPTT
jgi:hypothetical protein